MDIQCRWAGPLCCHGNGWATSVTLPSALRQMEWEREGLETYLRPIAHLYSLCENKLNASHTLEDTLWHIWGYARDVIVHRRHCSYAHCDSGVCFVFLFFPSPCIVWACLCECVLGVAWRWSPSGATHLVAVLISAWLQDVGLPYFTPSHDWQPLANYVFFSQDLCSLCVFVLPGGYLLERQLLQLKTACPCSIWIKE